MSCVHDIFAGTDAGYLTIEDPSGELGSFALVNIECKS